MQKPCDFAPTAAWTRNLRSRHPASGGTGLDSTRRAVAWMSGATRLTDVTTFIFAPATRPERLVKAW